MALDTRLPLAFHPGQQPDLDNGRALSLAQMQQQIEMAKQQQELNRQRMHANEQSFADHRSASEEKRRAAELRRQVQQILADEPDLEKAIPKVRGLDAAAADALSKHLDERRKADVDRQRSQFEMAEKRRAALGSSISAVLAEPDPVRRSALFQSQRAALVQSGMFQPEHLPEQMPDEAELRAFVQSSLTPVQQADLASKKGADERAAAGEKRNQETHEATLPGKKVNAEGLTPYQSATLSNIGETRKETKRYHDAQLSQGQQRISIAKDKAAKTGGGSPDPAKALHALRQEEMRLEKEEQTIGRRRAEIGGMTKTGRLVRNGKAEDLSAEERRRLDAEYTAADKRWNQIQTRKQEIKAKREQLQGGSGGAAPTLPQQARAALREGAVTTFRNGQRWTLRNGQPVQVP